MKQTEKIGFILFFFAILMLINLNVQSIQYNINFGWAILMYLLSIIGGVMFILN